VAVDICDLHCTRRRRRLTPVGKLADAGHARCDAARARRKALVADE
jgi:hypothetical protein